MFVNSKGLVPCEILKASASAGMRLGEIRGFPPDQVKRLVKAEAVRPLTEAEVKTKEREKAKAKSGVKPAEKKPAETPTE